jgi:hypothetical protein
MQGSCSRSLGIRNILAVVCRCREGVSGLFGREGGNRDMRLEGDISKVASGVVPVDIEIGVYFAACLFARCTTK